MTRIIRIHSPQIDKPSSENPTPRSNCNGGKIPKGSGNSWKVTWRPRSLLHLRVHYEQQSQRLHSAHIFLVGSREGLVLDILQVLLGISGVSPSPNFNQLIFHINLKRTKRQSQNIHSKHMQVHWLSFDSILRHWLFSFYIYILCLSIVLYALILYLVIYGCLWLNFKLLSNPFSLTSPY